MRKPAKTEPLGFRSLSVERFRTVLEQRCVEGNRGDCGGIENIDGDRPVIIKAGMEELKVERELFGGPKGLFRAEADVMPFCMAQFCEKFRYGGRTRIRRAGKVLSSGLNIGKGESWNSIGRGAQRLEAQRRQQTERS